MRAFKNKVKNWDGTVKLFKEKFSIKEKSRLVETFLNENHENLRAAYGKENT